MPQRWYFGGTFSDSSDLNVLPLSCPANHTGSYFMRHVTVYHLQNGYVKNETSLGGTTEIYKSCRMFCIFRGNHFLF